jgi:hypothetical protein
MKKENKIIKEKTIFIDNSQLIELELTDTFQIRCKFADAGAQVVWTGEIQKVYLDKKGEAYGYDVYVYEMPEDLDKWVGELQIDDIFKYADEYARKILTRQKQEFRKRLKRIKLDMDVVICDCGKPYKDSDPADLINELLKAIKNL